MVPPNSTASTGLHQFGLKVYRYKTLIKRHWWLLALFASIGLAYEGWVLYSMPKLMESNGKMTIREAVNAAVEQYKYSQGGESFVGTALAMMKSPEVLSRAQHRVALLAPDLANEEADVTTSVLPRTYIFTISAKGKNPDFVVKYVDAIREEFVAMRDETRGSAVKSAAGGVEDNIKLLEAQLKAQKAKLEKFVSDNDMQFWTTQAEAAARQLSELRTNRMKLQTDLQRLESLSPETLLMNPGSGEASRPAVDATGAPLGSDLYNTYLQQIQLLTQAKARLKERSTVWKDKHPKLQILKENVNELQAGVDLILQQNREMAEQRVKALRSEIEHLDKVIPEWEAKNKEAALKDSEYKALTAAVAATENGITKFRDSLLNLTPSEAKGDIFINAGPPTPATEVPKGIVKHLGLGLFAGLLLGTGILIFRDRSDDRLSSSSEMMEQFSEPILGQIPDVMSSRDPNGLPLVQPDDERYSFAEAFRSLRSSLIFMPNQTQLQTLLVTSAIPNEGKSTITANLGITMAAAGANIVLVDADLRRGDLASLFDMDGRTGLSNVLRGEVKWKDAIQETKYPGLTLLPRGPVTNQSSELLLLPTLETLLEELKEKYDLVLFNTAPILATDDTSSIAPHFDGSLMVIRAQFTSARLTRNALNALYQRQVNVLGLILNCVDTEMPDYYYYRYPKYYAAQ